VQNTPQFDRTWLERKYSDEQLSDREIAELAGCKPHHVYFARRRLGIASRPRGHNLRADSPARPAPAASFKGRRHTLETRQKIAQSVSKPCPARRGSGNGMYGRKGAANPNWKGGISPERQRIQSSAEYQAFVRQVCERDGHRCRRCGEHSTQKRGMHVHHVKPWDEYPELRMEMSNAALLCRACHEWVHSSENTARLWLEDKGGP